MQVGQLKGALSKTASTGFDQTARTGVDQASITDAANMSQLSAVRCRVCADCCTASHCAGLARDPGSDMYVAVGIPDSLYKL